MFTMFRLVLSSGATYKDARVLEPDEAGAVGIQTVFGEKQVSFIADGRPVFLHKSGIDTCQLSQERPNIALLEEPMLFDKLVLAGNKTYGPGYMAAIDKGGMEDAGIPSLPWWDEPVAFITNEGTFVTNSDKIHSVITPRGAGLLPSVRGASAAHVGVRSARNTPNAHQAVLQYMKDSQTGAGMHEGGEQAPAGPSVAGGVAAHPYEGRSVFKITTQADVDPRARELSEQRGDFDHEIIQELRKKEETNAERFANPSQVPTALSEQIRQGVNPNRPVGPKGVHQETFTVESAGRSVPGRPMGSSSVGGSVSPMGVSRNFGEPQTPALKHRQMVEGGEGTLPATQAGSSAGAGGGTQGAGATTARHPDVAGQGFEYKEDRRNPSFAARPNDGSRGGSREAELQARGITEEQQTDDAARTGQANAVQGASGNQPVLTQAGATRPEGHPGAGAASLHGGQDVGKQDEARQEVVAEDQRHAQALQQEAAEHQATEQRHLAHTGDRAAQEQAAQEEQRHQEVVTGEAQQHADAGSRTMEEGGTTTQATQGEATRRHRRRQ